MPTEEQRDATHDASVVRAGLIGLANHVRACPAYAKLVGDMEVVDLAIALLDASAPTPSAPTAPDVGHALIERLRKTMTRLGVFPGEGLEWFAANLESNLYSLDRAVNAMLDSVAPTAPAQEPVPWRCFHCGEVFTNETEAAEHFGTSQHQEPACQIDIAKYRDMEGTVRRYNEEDTDLHREIYRLQAKHQTELRREEEKGYARGLADAVKHPSDAAPAQGEPVAYTSHDRLEKIARNQEHVDTMWGAGRLDEGDIALYTTPRRTTAPIQGEHVGVAVNMPGNAYGFTMAAFKAIDVPAGTPLYTIPQPAPAVAKEGMTDAFDVVLKAIDDCVHNWGAPLSGAYAQAERAAIERVCETVRKALLGAKGE